MPSPEQSILLLAARASLAGGEQAELARLASGALDWGSLVDAAAAHRLGPLLHHHLEQQQLGTRVPAPHRDVLARLAHTGALRALRLRSQLRAILLAADEDGIHALVMKGAALAERVYGNRALRPMDDLDLLVPHDQFARFEAVLVKLGYRLRLRDPRARAPRERLHFHLTYAQPGAVAIVEAHWHPRPVSQTWPFGLDISGIWGRARETRIAGAPAYAMSADDEVVMLALHHFAHGSQRLLGFCDLAEVVRSEPGLSWEAVIERAQATGGGAVVGHSLWWVKEYLQAPVPNAVVAALCPDAAQRERRRASTGSPVARAGLVRNPWAVLSRQLPFLPGPLWRLRFVRRVLMPAPGLVAWDRAASAAPWDYVAYLFRRDRLRRAAASLQQAWKQRNMET